MNVDVLRKVPTIQEFFKIEPEGDIPAETAMLLNAMEEVVFEKGQDVVTFGADSADGMYVILEGTTDVLNSKQQRINILGPGDFIGELGLINDNKRGATVRALDRVVCANISKSLFEELAMHNRKVYGIFMNMLYVKTTNLVTVQERMKSELAIATRIQSGCLEDDFTEFNKLKDISITATMRPAKEVGGDFYDVFMIDDTHICFLVADVSGKGVPAALFMSMAKIHIKNYAALGLPLAEVVSRANNQLCYKNEEGMFVTSFICVLDVETDEVKFVNAGHNLPYIYRPESGFEVVSAKANLVLGMMEDIPYREQRFTLKKGESLYLFTDGVTEATNSVQELFGEQRLLTALNNHVDNVGCVNEFVTEMFKEVDDFAAGEMQADDITMLYISRV